MLNYYVTIGGVYFMNLLNDVTGAIGNTPMVNLSGIAKAFNVEGNISLNQSI